MRLLPISMLAFAGASLACAKPQPPTVVPEKATVTSVDSKRINLDVTLNVTNPNSADITIRDVTAHVVVAQKIDLGSMTLPQEGTLPSGKSTPIHASLAVPWTDLNALAQLVGTSATVPFTVDGSVELGGELVHLSVPYHLAGSMTQQQLLTATLRSLPGLPGIPPPR